MSALQEWAEQNGQVLEGFDYSRSAGRGSIRTSTGTVHEYVTNDDGDIVVGIETSDPVRITRVALDALVAHHGWSIVETAR